MKAIIKRLEHLERTAGTGKREIVIIRKIIDVDSAGQINTIGGLRKRPSQPYESLPVSFFDQEDNGNINGQDWILGSRSFVNELEEYPDQVIILDMVGDIDLNLYYERNSYSKLLEEIWQIGIDLGYSEIFIPEYRFSMIDDHTPFIQAGIPAIDIIDFDYPYWHTTEEVVGVTIMNWLETISDE